jgi:hypothetical protein
MGDVREEFAEDPGVGQGARVAESIPRDVSRSDIKSMFRCVKPFSGMSVASWSIMAPVKSQ